MAMLAEAAYDKGDLKIILRSFKAMDEAAVEASKRVGYELAQELMKAIQSRARTRQEQRISATGRVSKSSKVGEFSFGYQRQAFSGGANTSKNLKGDAPYGNGILAGVEFGSNLSAHFRPRTPRLGAGNEGYWIYPTLESKQPDIIARWEKEFDKILEEFK